MPTYPKVWEAVKEEILKWLNAEIIYPISDSQWVSHVHVVSKKVGVTVNVNEKGEEIQTRLPTKWRVSIDYRKLNAATKKDHFSLSFIDQILDRLAHRSPEKDPRGLHQETTGIELGEIPFYGARGSSARAS